MRSWSVVELGTEAYRDCWARQLALVEQRKRDEVPDTLLLVEHPHVFTLGRRREAEANVLMPGDIEVIGIERGGDVTYHGPGQVVVYPIRRLERFREVVPLVSSLETAVTGALYRFGIEAQPRHEHRGVYVGDDAICAIGLAVKRMTSMHGLALNACTALDYDRLITPCGTPQFGITSISAQTGREVSWAEARDALLDSLEGAFGVEFARETLAPGSLLPRQARA